MADATVAILTDAGGAHLDGYFTGLTKSDEVTSVILSDPSGQSEASARRVLGAKLTRVVVDHSHALAEHKPQMALVTLEAVMAPPVIRAALDANCHVMAEKPSCIKIEDFAGLVQLADMKHRFLLLAFANRLRGTVQAARKMIASGEIGQIYGCELHIVADQTRLKNSTYHQSWFANPARSGGGHLMWLGIHWIDLVMYLTGAKIVDVTGFTGNVGGQPIKIEDSAAMAFRFDNGSFGTLTSGYYLDRGYHSKVKVWGSKGWLQLEPHGPEPFQWYTTKDTPAQIKKYEGPADETSYTPLVRAWVRASLDLAPPPLTTADSLQALKTVFAGYRAAMNGQSQHVD